MDVNPRLTTGIQLPKGLAVGQMEITDDLTDCAFEGGGETLPPSGCRAEQAAGGFGRIEFSGVDVYHQTISLHATLLFTANGVVPPQSIELDADGLELM